MQPRIVNLKFPDKTTLQMEIATPHGWPRAIKRIRPHLKANTILALSGPLGAGKTTFVQALAHALEIKVSPPSPTFALMRSYELPKPVNGICRLIHVDAYRLENEREILVLDLDEELSDGKSLLVIEWPEKIPKFISAHNTNVIHLAIEV